VPLSSSIGEFWPPSLKFVALPQACQITLTSRSQAVYIAFRLVQSLLMCSKANQMTKSNTAGFILEGHLPWTLEICCSLWQCFRRFKQAERDRLSDAVETLYMEVLQTAALPNLVAAGNSPYSLKTGVILSMSLAELVQICATSPISVANQVRLASTLTRLRGVLQSHVDFGRDQCRSPRSLKNVITDTMAPSILGTCQSEAKYTALQKDLQVSPVHEVKYLY
jgi:serine/threonine-protein kinase ATR